MDQSLPACTFCGEPVGVHERVIVIEHEGERETSLAREPEIVDRPRLLLVHSSCAPEGWREAS
jgi:hypothetical protein